MTSYPILVKTTWQLIAAKVNLLTALIFGSDNRSDKRRFFITKNNYKLLNINIMTKKIKILIAVAIVTISVVAISNINITMTSDSTANLFITTKNAQAQSGPCWEYFINYCFGQYQNCFAPGSACGYLGTVYYEVGPYYLCENGIKYKIIECREGCYGEGFVQCYGTEVYYNWEFVNEPC